MENDETARLTLTYEQFVEVLRQWDAYASVEFSEMARNSSIYLCTENEWFGSRPSPGYAFIKKVEISDLAELLWKTLEAGAAEVDRIHDTAFVESQVEHFKKTYASPEHVASVTIDEHGHCYTLDPPTTMFFKLGKPAQIVLTREGLLEEAIEIYEQGQEIVHNKMQANKIEQAHKRQEEKNMIETRRRVRELDKNQCTFCGAQINKNFRYVRITEGEYEPDKVILSCSPCKTERKQNPHNEAHPAPSFGRFAQSPAL
jgi:hypothetical protein